MSNPNLYPSLAAMQTEHNRLLHLEHDGLDTSEFLTRVEHFIKIGSATGAVLDATDDRRIAQSMLNLWANKMYRRGLEPPDASLAPFDVTLAPMLDDARCPYLGLDAFGESKSDVFYGRQRLVEELVNRLDQQQVLAVIGPSGSGKSSVVRGGLVPSLKQGSLPNSQSWHYFPTLVPGSDPLAGLVRAIKPAKANLSDWVNRHTQGMLQQPDYLARLVGALTQVPAVFVIDQFEEIFTLCNDNKVRNAFIANLFTLLRVKQSRHIIILTMRSDFETYFARIPTLQQILEQCRVQVTPMSVGELREAIELPGERVGLKFEQGVVEDLLRDILGEPAGLPLLQFTLLKLWEKRDRNRVTSSAYRNVGGGRLALARSADAFYAALIPEEQTTAKRILLRMVRPGEGLEVTSNRIRRSELYLNGEDPSRVDRVLTKLAQAHLVRLSEGDSPSDGQVEVAHEALVRNWPQLVDWLDEERAVLRQRQRITIAAEQWQASGKNSELLWRGSLIDEALRLVKDLNKLERDFVTSSLSARAASELERENALKRELARERELASVQLERIEAERLQSEAQARRIEEQARAEEQTRAAGRLRRLAFALSIVSLLAVAGILIIVVLVTTSNNSIQNLNATITSSNDRIQALDKTITTLSANSLVVQATSSAAAISAATSIAADNSAQINSTVQANAAATSRAERSIQQAQIALARKTSTAEIILQSTRVSAVYATGTAEVATQEAVIAAAQETGTIEVEARIKNIAVLQATGTAEREAQGTDVAVAKTTTRAQVVILRTAEAQGTAVRAAINEALTPQPAPTPTANP